MWLFLGMQGLYTTQMFPPVYFLLVPAGVVVKWDGYGAIIIHLCISTISQLNKNVSTISDKFLFNWRLMCFFFLTVCVSTAFSVGTWEVCSLLCLNHFWLLVDVFVFYYVVCMMTWLQVVRRMLKRERNSTSEYFLLRLF